jgi:NAD(P) transhydrogenase subunit beta
VSGRVEAIRLIYLAAAVCFILALKGLSGPRTAQYGNWIGAAGALLAVAVTFAVPGIHNVPLIILGIAVGAAIGVPAARMVKMTAIPQMVAMFNGVGGAAAALVSVGDFGRGSATISVGSAIAVVFSALIGCISFSGSLVTFAKLQELMTGRPVVLPGQRYLSSGIGALALGLGIYVLATDSVGGLIAMALVALAFGVLFVLPVGGADVPIVISLLNAFTGLAVAATGVVLQNTLLIVAGTLVGASGTLLTRMMSAAMGRSLPNILFGAFTMTPVAAGAETGEVDRTYRTGSAADIAILLAYARKVIIVPGYGLAVAQAQHAAHELSQLLQSKGVEVSYGIHPVAGRMPGHMNVLLAEANVPYDQLREMDSVNPEFSRTDVVLVVGANDVVNPAARDSPGSPIYGMPILNVDEAANVVFLKRSMRPGFAGIDNALLYNHKTTMLFGDAKETLTALVAAVKAV